jgi:hypothetical protein
VHDPNDRIDPLASSAVRAASCRNNRCPHARKA